MKRRTFLRSIAALLLVPAGAIAKTVRGGAVLRSGVAYVHPDEIVIPAGWRPARYRATVTVAYRVRYDRETGYCEEL
jgi:hypothetical protein